MLSSIASNGVNTSIVSSERNIESDNRIASLDEVVHIFGYIGFSSGSGQELLNLIQKSSFSGVIRAEVSVVCEFYNIEKRVKVIILVTYIERFLIVRSKVCFWQ
jgi:hypothetical protein